MRQTNAWESGHFYCICTFCSVSYIFSPELSVCHAESFTTCIGILFTTQCMTGHVISPDVAMLKCPLPLRSFTVCTVQVYRHQRFELRCPVLDLLYILLMYISLEFNLNCICTEQHSKVLKIRFKMKFHICTDTLVSLD